MAYLRKGLSSGTLTQPTFPAGHTLKHQYYVRSSDIDASNTADYQVIFEETFSPTGGSANNSTIYAQMHCMGQFYNNATNGRKNWFVEVSGDDITNKTYARSNSVGCYDYGSSGINMAINFLHGLPPVTLDGTGNADITYIIKVQNGSASAGQGIEIYGDSTNPETYLLVWEVQ